LDQGLLTKKEYD
jgi:hypothetical protein